MKKTTILGALVFCAIAGTGLLLFAGDQHPSALFLEYCARCHGQDGTASTPKGKQLMARDFTDEEWQSSKNDTQLIKQVTAGSEAMPAFGKKLTKEQIEGLVKNDVRGFARKK